MTFWQDRSNWELHVAEVWFENFAALDNWEAYFKTDEGKDIGARVKLQLKSLSVCSIQVFITNLYFRLLQTQE